MRWKASRHINRLLRTTIGGEHTSYFTAHSSSEDFSLANSSDCFNTRLIEKSIVSCKRIFKWVCLNNIELLAHHHRSASNLLSRTAPLKFWQRSRGDPWRTTMNAIFYSTPLYLSSPLFLPFDRQCKDSRKYISSLWLYKRYYRRLCLG